MNPPRAFISYSHDTAEHKKWVLNFATTLRNRGIDAVLDQWDLKPGDDLPHFMETQLEAADYILMICSENYVKKANAGAGGVGYEKMIITSTLLSKIDENKVIPVIRQKGTDNRPTFLKTKLYINFSKDSEIEYSFDELLRTMLNSPLYKKPKIGENPFMPMEASTPERTSDGVKEIMKAIAEQFENKTLDYIYKSDLIQHTSIHRLALDKYILDAKNEGLIKQDKYKNIYMTPSGLDYLIEHEVI